MLFLIIDMLISAIHAVLEDSEFKLPSTEATQAHTAAISLLAWCQCTENQSSLTNFSTILFRQLQRCIPPTVASQVQREKMWVNFHELRTSSVFFQRWSNFLKTPIPSPILFQYLTDYIFKQLIKKCFPVDTNSTASTSSGCIQLSYMEKNALRYAAGYIPHALKKKVACSGHPHEVKAELQRCLLDLIEADGIDDESQDWEKILDRGGLKHSNTKMYVASAAMESVVQAILTQISEVEKKREEDVKTIIIEAICLDEDVNCSWRVVASDWQPEESKLLFSMIVDLWVKMRGFAYASAWMEKHKLDSKKNLQKSKGLRKTITT